MKRAKVRAAEFDRKFEAGEDISAHVDWAKSKRVQPKLRRIQLNLPEPLAESLDKEATRRGVKLQKLVEQWLNDSLAKAA